MVVHQLTQLSPRCTRVNCPAYHMNRDNWISIPPNGSTEDDGIYVFLDMSVRNVENKAKAK